MHLRKNLAPRALAAASLACGSLAVLIAFTSFTGSATAQATSQSATQATTTASKLDGGNTAQNAKPSSYTATIAVEEALIRSAASTTDSGYPFGTLSKGAVVTVVETVPGWVRVRTEGAAFQGWGGYVPALPGVALSADGKSIKITGTAPINAANGTADYSPDRSWKAIGYLTTGDTLPVLEVVKGERETFYAVPLSAKTSGWISESAIARGDVTNTKPAEAVKPESKTTESKTTETTPAPTTTDAATTAAPADATTTAAGETKPANAKTGDATTSDGKTAESKPAPKVIAKPVPVTTPGPISISYVKFSDLEARWNKVDRQNCSLADLHELQNSYSELAKESGALRATRNSAMARSTQIGQVIELREMKDQAARIAARGEDKSREVADLEEWLRARQRFTAVGTLNASVVYDGERLPRLYRLQEPTSGITTAYLLEDPDLKLSSMLGLVVGVKGEVKFDESLRRNIITPASITVLQTGKETQVAAPAKVESTGSSEETNK